jgi:hypothetical protein
MVIAGVVQNGEVRIDVHGLIPDGTQFVVRSVETSTLASSESFNIERSKAELRQVIELPSSSPDDGFCSSDHDRILYGDGG